MDKQPLIVNRVCVFYYVYVLRLIDECGPTFIQGHRCVSKVARQNFCQGPAVIGQRASDFHAQWLFAFKGDRFICMEIATVLLQYIYVCVSMNT